MIKHDWTITAKESLFYLKHSDLLQYRHLFYQLVYRDIVASYKQTILGPAWLIVHPIITMFVFTLIFGKIINVSTEGLPKPLFYLSGIICWNYFSECLNRTSSVYKDNINIFAKIYFPRIIVPISLAISMSCRFLIHLLLLFLVMIIYHEQPFHFHTVRALAIIPILILTMAMLGVGIGLIVSCLTIRYKDLNFVIAFGLQLTMYTTTVIFPLSSAPAKLKLLVQSNPMTPLIETFRFALFNIGTFNINAMIYSFICSLLIFGVGYILFNRMEKTFIDTI